MFKKIDKYLLENHPVIWNTKFVWMLIIGLVFNLGFFLFGLLSFQNPIELQDYHFFSRYFTSVYVWIAVLAALLILILWLNHYFKQNAFKSHYPKTNSSLYKEFCIIFVLIFLLSGTYFSFTKGLELRVKGFMSKVELDKKIDLVNRVAPFGLQSDISSGNSNRNGDYSHINRCLEVPLFDSLVNQDELLKRYVANSVKKSRWWEKVDSTQYQLYKDSLSPLINTHNEYDYLLLEKLPQRRNWKYLPQYKTAEEFKENNYNRYNRQGHYETIPAPYYEEIDSTMVSVSYNLHSIYNFCEALISTDTIKNGEYYAKQTHQLLANQQKDSIQILMKEYLELADKLQVGYRFKDKEWIDYVYNPPYYFVDDELLNSTRYNTTLKKTFYKDYVSENAMKESLDTIQKAHEGVIEFDAILFWLYFAMGLSLLIFTFRMTSMRSWLVALVGSIVVFFVLLSVFFIFGMLLRVYDSILASLLFLGAVLIFWIFTFFGIQSNKRKMVSGVTLNWKIWTFGALIPVLLALYHEILDFIYPSRYVTVNGVEVYKQHPYIEWIGLNIQWIFLANFFLIFVYIFLIIPLLKRWQAMAEE
jgi:hypothetical protein